MGHRHRPLPKSAKAEKDTGFRASRTKCIGLRRPKGSGMSSKPGRRSFSSVKAIPPVLDGLGISILSTNQGVLSNREAQQKHVGGEVLCSVW